MNEALRQEVEALKDEGLYRELRRAESAPGPHIVLEGREVLNFGSNNYLGLSEHPAVREAAHAALDRWGPGASGSRLTSGNLALHEELEAEIAAFKGTEAALVFSSGYAANTGMIPAMARKGDLILSDALNHASLIDGCRLSRAETRVYRHRDTEHLLELFEDQDAHRKRPTFRRILVVTDGVFSMDGDLAPIPELCDLAERHDLWLVVDDAHGTGVLGATGAGTVQHFNAECWVHAQMGTLSKALGAEGGFVAGSQRLIDLLRNRARSFIFSTALAPPTAAAGLAALRAVRSEPERRGALRRNGAALRARLREAGLAVPEGETPIIPVVVGSARRATAVAEALLLRGVWAPAIRPPTVPEGTSRLRFSVMATHTPEDIEAAARALCEALGEVRP